MNEQASLQKDVICLGTTWYQLRGHGSC